MTENTGFKTASGMNSCAIGYYTNDDSGRNCRCFKTASGMNSCAIEVQIIGDSVQRTHVSKPQAV